MRRQLTLTCMTMAVAGFCLAGPRRVEAASTGDEQAIQRLAQALASVQALARQAAPYDAVFRRDPMRPLVNEQGEVVSFIGLQGGLSVQGVIWSDASPLVVIDDELHAQGDVIGPYTIQQVQPDGITVQRGSDTLFVPLDRGIEVPREHVVMPPALGGDPVAVQ